MVPFLALLVISTLPIPAFGDYEPGRTRPSAEADPLHVIEKNGIYGDTERAKIVELSTDGRGVTAYVLATNAGQRTFLVAQARRTRCGDLYIAVPESYPDKAFQTRLVLQDVSRTACRTERNRGAWKVEVESVDKDSGERSKLTLEGNPEHFMLTQ